MEEDLDLGDGPRYRSVNSHPWRFQHVMQKYYEASHVLQASKVTQANHPTTQTA